MANTEHQNINLHIYDTDIKIQVPRDEEEYWRRAVQLVNDKLNAYFGAFKGIKCEKEIHYDAMIDIALKYVKETQRNDVEPITNILSQLSDEINAELN